VQTKLQIMSSQEIPQGVPALPDHATRRTLNPFKLFGLLQALGLLAFDVRAPKILPRDALATNVTHWGRRLIANPTRGLCGSILDHGSGIDGHDFSGVIRNMYNEARLWPVFVRATRGYGARVSSAPLTTVEVL
jgi:hypothetical protein